MHPINPNMIKNSHQIARESQIVAKEARLAGTTVLNIAKTSKSIYNYSLIKPALRNVKLAGGLTKRLIDLQDMIKGVFKKTEDHNNKENIDQKHSRGQRQLIKACNFLSWSYIAGDVTYETLKAYNYHHSSTGKVPSNSTESENPPSDYRMVFIERSLFHMITTVMIPTFAIKYIIKFSVSYVFNPVNYITLNSFATKLRSKEASKHSIHSLVDKSSLQRLLFFRLGPFLVVSTIFPFIPRYLDKPVEKYLHRAFKAVSK